MLKPLQFSYSFLSQEENCPEAARQLYILKAFKKSYSVQGGIDDHKVLEDRLRYDTPLPAPLEKAEPLVRSLEVGGKPEVEVSFAVDRSLKPVNFWDGYLRGKYDVLKRAPLTRSAFLGDWKSGKIRESRDQLELGAMLIMRNDPAIDKVVGANIWLQAPRIGVPYTFLRQDMDALWVKWVRRMQVIEKRDPNTAWEMRPGMLCGYCPVMTCPHYKGG